MTHEEKRIIEEYRGLLTKTEQESQEEFDKTVLALSGGALGLSFAFLKDIVGPENMVHTGWLFAAWIQWGLSSGAVLVSFYTSQLAMRKAIRQLDEKKLHAERAGGSYDEATKWLNFTGMVLFLLGLAAMLFFLHFNLKDHMPAATNVKQQQTPQPK